MYQVFRDTDAGREYWDDVNHAWGRRGTTVPNEREVYAMLRRASLKSFKEAAFAGRAFSYGAHILEIVEQTK